MIRVAESSNADKEDSTPKKAQDTPKNTRRPVISNFWQQNLSAWEPMINSRTVFPFFLIIGFIFVILGAVLLNASFSVSEIIIPYTHCTMENSTTKCSEEVLRFHFFIRHKTCKCRVIFNLTTSFKREVFMYYGLTNFYQNHRMYLKSRSYDQLLGRNVSIYDIEDRCWPHVSTEVNGSKKIIAPCGLIANSIFNDTFKLYYRNDKENIEVGLLRNDISWKLDKYVKFGIPAKESWKSTVKPPAWPKSASDRVPDAYRGDEDLQVWMRPAPLPKFRKLYRRINHDSHPEFNTGLPKGRYELEVQYAYPVTPFRGEKQVILSTTSWMGGRNPTLGIGYLVVGITQMILGMVFYCMHSHARKQSLEIRIISGRITYRTSSGPIEPQPVFGSSNKSVLQRVSNLV